MMLFAAVTLTLIIAAALGGSGWPIVVSMILVEGAYALLWLIAMSGIGSGTLRCLGAIYLQIFRSRSLTDALSASPRSLQAVTTTAIGIGITSTVVLLLGVAGLIGSIVVWAIVVAGLLFACFEIVQSPRREEWLDWLRSSPGWDAAILIAVLPAAVAVAGACVVPGVLWGAEPNGYDVVEYHLQIPREWYELGRIMPLTHNLFSYFPFNVEMHYLLAMHLRGGPWRGMYLAQFINVAMMGLFLLAVYGSLRPRGRASAAIGAVLAATTPWITLLAPVAYNEGGLLLFATLSIVWAMRGMASHHHPSRSVAMFTFAGAFAGFAIGTKLTAAPLIAVGLPVCLLLARPSAIRKLITPLAMFGVMCVATASPWLVRNHLWTGNMLFPEATKILGVGPFSSEQQQRWATAHSATPSQQNISARIGSLINQVFIDIDVHGASIDYRAFYGLLLLPVGIVVLAVRWKDWQTRPLALLLIWLTLFWLFFTHLQARFYILAIPLTAIGVASIYRPTVRYILASLIVLTAIPSLVIIGAKVVAMSPFIGIEDVSQMMKLGMTDAEAEKILTFDRPLVLAGDARAFWYPLGKGRLFYRTVFDVDAKPGESVVDAWTRGAPKDAMILVTPSELERFHKTYLGIPSAPNQIGRSTHLIVP